MSLTRNPFQSFSNALKSATVEASVETREAFSDKMNKSNHAFFIHPAGWPFIAVAVVITLGLLLFGGVAFMVGLLVTGWVVYFFRNPKRMTPIRPGLVVSPADGKICAISEVVPDETLGLGQEPRTRISIFLNVFDVHINRSPVEGEVLQVIYRPGAFVNASLDKASVDNERNALVIKMADGQMIGVVQIAGLIARRIVCFVKEGVVLKAGERFGLIRFGSRTDVYLPVGMKALVCVGQRAVGGETVLADAISNEEAREGEAR